IGLTASSIAIMGAVAAEKGGAAGALESTGYELGAGLGITLFGVFMASVFSSAIQLPAGLAPPLAQQAARSIGGTFLVARDLPAGQGEALIAAGQAAFHTAYVALLSVAAIVMGLLGMVVFALLAG